LIEVDREERESLDSLIKRLRRQVTKHKVLQEVKQRAFYVSKALKRRLKAKRTDKKRR